MNANDPENQHHRRPGGLRNLWLALALTAFAAAPATAQEDDPLAADPPPAPATVEIEEPADSRAEAAAEVRALETALAERREAVAEVRRRLDRINDRLAQLSAEYENLRQRLDTAGLDVSGEFASLLRRRLDRLQSRQFDDELLVSIQAQVEAARIEQFRLEELEAALSGRGSPAAPDTLRQRRTELVTALSSAVAEHIKVLDEYFAAARQIRGRIAAYQSLLSEQLFWLPSEPSVGRDSLTGLARSGAWLVSPGLWQETLAGVPASARAHAVPLLLLILALAALVVTRGWLKRRLHATATHIGKVGRDSFAVSLTALACTLVLALPWPLLLTALALTVAEAGAFGEALASGLMNAALLVFLLWFLFHVARRDGLAERHFKWPAEVLRAIRLGVPGLLLVLVPSAILTALTEAAVGEQYRESLGRAAFAAASLALAWFAHGILRAVATAIGSARGSRWLRALRVLAVGAPLVLAAFSLYGYHFTAVQLQATLFMTACWLVAVLLIHFLALRALAIRERRLALARLRAQREAEKALSESRDAAEAAGEAPPVAPEEPELDLKTVSSQTQALLRLVIGVLTAVGLWLLWSDVIPALRVLDGIDLWQVAPATEGGTPTSVSLQDLLLALAIGALTVLAARNLPGMMEVALLGRLQLGPGGSYAITTLSTYIIVIVGVFVTLGFIGAQWSKLQWLVAALGVGLGFGLQEIVANFVSGIILLFEQPIRVGDTVTVGEKTGTVTRIRIRATTLVDWDRKEQIVPNKTFVTQDLTNWTLSDSIVRVVIKVGVPYAADIEQVHGILTQVVESNDLIAKEPPPSVYCVNFGDSSIDFDVRIFVKGMLDYLPAAHQVRAHIVRALRENGIEIPFPQRDIHIIPPAGGEAPLNLSQE